MKRALVLLILISVVPFAVLAQAPEIGRIAIYADSFRTVNEVDLSAPYTMFDVYICCQPSENGLFCAEFKLASSNESMVISNTAWHTGTSIVLGDLTSGASACFLECQADWVCIARVSMLNSTIDPASIDIVRHPEVGYYQFASCLEDRPTEPVFYGPGVHVNSTSTLDTDPPVPTAVDVEDDIRLTLYFNEKVFEPDAIDPGSYSIYRADGLGYTIPVNFMVLQGEEDRVWMVLGQPLAVASYYLEVKGLRDIAGNSVVPGTRIAFGGIDTISPELLNAYAPDDTTVILVFSEWLDESSAEDRWNYSFAIQQGGTAPAALSAELQPDGLSVKVILIWALQQEKIYEVSVEGVADLAGNMIVQPAVVSFKPPDKTPPYVTQASFDADTALVILWNEVIDPGSAEDLENFSMFRDGPPAEPMSMVSADLAGEFGVKLIFNPAIDMEEIYTLYISGVMDTSMNAMLPDTFKLAPHDTIPPVLASVVCMGIQAVDLIFSEPVDPAVTGWWTHFQVYPVGHIEDMLEVIDISIPGQANVVRLQFMISMTPGSDYTARALTIPDLAGNSIAAQQIDFTCYDVYPPEVVEIFLPDLTHVNLRFNEVVDGAVSDPESYLLYITADSAAVVDITSAVLYDGGTRTVITTALPLTDGELYSLKMSGIGDLLGNMIDPDRAWPFTAEDTVDPILLSLTVTSDSLVHLLFNESLDPATAEDIANYAVVEAGDTSDHLPLQAASLDSAGTTVDLEIDGRARTEVPYVVWIRGVADSGGNELYDASGSFLFIDDIPPHLLSAVGASVRTVVVFFDERITYTTSHDKNNYTLYPAGDPTSEISIFQAIRLVDQKSVSLVLNEDLVQDTDYTLEVSGVMDHAGYTIDPSSVDFLFHDATPPVILNVELINASRVSISFNEVVDSVTARDTGNYSVYITSNSSQTIAVASVDWMADEVRLNLASEVTPNVNYTVRIDGVEDRFGNVASELYGSFRYDVYVPSSNMYLLAEDGSHDVDVETLYMQFSFYVWVDPGGNGVFGVEYALSPPQTYVMIGSELNSIYSAVTIGDPYNGHSIGLSMCAQDLFWAVRINCICLIPGVQEIVMPLAHPSTGLIQVASCLPDHPLETVAYVSPLLINPEYIGTLLDSWDVSFRSGGVELNWSILETERSPEFEVLRTQEEIEAWRQLDGGLIRGEGLRYTMLDTDLEPGRSYRYRVECLENDERKILFETDAVSIPDMPLTLRQNSPNPFNPSTSINFFLPKPGHVRLEIFDVNGRLVNVLTNGNYTSGEHSVDWNGRDRTGSMVSSGVYFYRLIAGKESLSRKMVLLR